MSFDRSTIEIRQIREDEEYAGKRLTLRCRLGSARQKIQIDIGIGDAVVPPPVWFEYPTLLDLPRPRLRVYDPATAVAEETHALVRFGAVNSRMKDFFDMWRLSRERAFDGAVLVSALTATFGRRRTEFPDDQPLGLTAAFAEVEGKQAQWTAFLDKNGLDSAPRDLRVVIDELAEFLGPVIDAGREGDLAPGTWPPRGPWHE